MDPPSRPGPSSLAIAGPSTSAASSSEAPPAKRRKSSKGKDDDGDSREPKKRLPSCDVCRARKVKCVKHPGASSCEGCISLSQKCEYTYERKKPGPANSFARKPTPPPSNPFPIPNMSPHPPVMHHRSYSHGDQVPPYAHYDLTNRWPPAIDSALGITMPIPVVVPPIPPSDPRPQSTQPLAPNLSQYLPESIGFPTDASWLPISPNSLLHPQPGELDSASEQDSPMGRWPWMNPTLDEIWDPRPPSTSSAPPATHPGSGGMTGMTPDESRSNHSLPLKVEAPRHAVGVGGWTADEKLQRIEDIVPFSMITKILQAYHAHLYPLMPVVHWPTFSQQLVAREDESNESWRAFVLSLVAYAIIQLPRSSLSFLPVKDLRRLHQRCHAESIRLQNRRYREVKLIDVATLYCDHIYLGTLGRTHLANLRLAEAIRLAQMLNLHDERLCGPIYDAVERETRRRVFWLLYGSDRTITALTSVPMHIQDWDICLAPPLAIDDTLLTSAGAFTQPANTTPPLAGFYFNVRLFRLLGAVLTAHREVMSSSLNPLTDPFPINGLPPLSISIRPASHFFDELERILEELPGPLQLVNPTGDSGRSTTTQPTPGTVMSGNMGSAASDGTPTGIRAGDAPAFATCRANLLVTQAMVRFAIRQYAKQVGEDEGQKDGREWAERDVLSLLESMSSESLAANGESLRRKVLFVASSLLEKYPSTTEGHNYVSDFLAVYTRISEEQHAALIAESNAPSRDASPG